MNKNEVISGFANKTHVSYSNQLHEVPYYKTNVWCISRKQLEKFLINLPNYPVMSVLTCEIGKLDTKQIVDYFVKNLKETETESSRQRNACTRRDKERHTKRKLETLSKDIQKERQWHRRSTSNNMCFHLDDTNYTRKTFINRIFPNSILSVLNFVHRQHIQYSFHSELYESSKKM